MGLSELFLAAIALSVVVTVYGDTNPVEAAALNSMYSGLNSPPQLTNWNMNGGDPCGQSWRGIVCSGPNITEIKIAGLGLAGSMGYQLDKLLFVTVFDLSNNNFGNDIPYQLPPNAEQLNIAGNNFTGSLPYSISQMLSLKLLNAGHNHLQGPLGDMFGQLANLTSLDLSFNNYTGILPHSFSSLTNLTSMYLQNNSFSGDIGVLSTLPLITLNVENNNFSGWIPDQLRGKNFQIGGNTWSSSPAPPPPPFTPPPSRKTDPGSRSDGGGSSSNWTDNKGKSSGLEGGVIAGIVVGIVAISALVAFFVIKGRSKKPPSDQKLNLYGYSAPVNDTKEVKPFQIVAPVFANDVDSSIAVSLLKPLPIDGHKSFKSDDMSTSSPIQVKKTHLAPVDATLFSVADLQMATGSFSMENLIGEGSSGRVYKAKFDDGKVLAVKNINSSSLYQAAEDDFMEIVSDISRLHHPNVVELVGYCSEHGQHLLVYEFFRNGSLHDFLHLSDEYSKPLDWSSRVKIALGSARALEYLHEVCSPSVIHKNLKSANILLDNELNPRLSDSGLSSFLSNMEHENASSGYRAPEVAMSGQYTMKSDVYSFGVVMLELLTGRLPFDNSRPRSEQSLVRWATPQLHDIDALANMVDPALGGLYPPKSLSRLADVVALCVQAEPEFRPPMSEVVQALVRLVQRANMSRRTLSGDENRLTRRASDLETDP